MLDINNIGANAMIHTRDHQTPYLFVFARLKAIAVNLFRATAVRKALGLPGKALAAAKSGIRHTIYIFKEQFLKPMGLLASIFMPATDQPCYELKIAA